MQQLRIAPNINPLNHIILPHVEQVVSNSGVPIYRIIKDDCEVVKCELVFLAGRPYESVALAATTTAFMLREGSKKLNSEEIAEQLDFYGATLNIKASLDTITVQVVCLKKYMTAIMDIIRQILLEPVFPESELQLMKDRRVQRLKIELAKNEVVSYRILTESIYGDRHPYGYNSSELLYQAITRQDIIDHYERFIHRNNCFIFLAGDVRGESIISSIETLLDELPTKEKISLDRRKLLIDSKLERAIKTTGNPLQASIRIGRKTFNRTHEDYYPFVFLSTVLGGYFSSRLTTNIREEKGLTYGIYSMLDTLLYDGSFMIATDVATDKVGETLSEIYKEMEILQNDLVPDEEMDLVRNYLAGNYINFFDGPFNSIKAIKSLVLSQIPLSDLKSLVDISQSINAHQVLDIAQKYLNRNDFWEVIVGASAQDRNID